MCASACTSAHVCGGRGVRVRIIMCRPLCVRECVRVPYVYEWDLIEQFDGVVMFVYK